MKYRQKGITLIALVITIIVLIILAGVFISMLVGKNGIITQAQRAKEETDQAQKEEEKGLSSLETQIEEALGNVYDQEKGVNAPRLASGMTPIKFTDPTSTEKGMVVTTNSEDTDWYNYNEKKWANAQTQDGSMWVWIPRFAYRVNSSTKTFDVVFLIGTTDTYYDENGEVQTAKRCTSENERIDTSTGYTVHPAFTDETAINYRNGGWDKEITGIWMAKFEAGYASGNNDAEVKASSVNYTQAQSYVKQIERGKDEDGLELARNWLDGVYGNTTTSIKYPVFQPLTYSMNYINHNDSYNIAKTLTEDGNIYGFTQSADSHLMKNSEWGAITYLTKSKYGINSENIATTNVSLNSGSRERTETNGKTEVDSVYAVTGCTTGAIGTDSVEKITTIDKINSTSGNIANDGIYTWNQLNGTKLSSTGTIYGIYDLNGGVWERVADYIANENEYLKIYGESISYDQNKLRTVSSKYSKVYLHDSTTDNINIDINNNTLGIAAQNNWNKNQLVYGDAIIETSTGKPGNYGWNNSYTYFLALDGCYMSRGAYWTAKAGGFFSYLKTNGTSFYSDGFRVTLIVP